jgi:DNA polymerase elongation subunit (family B)
LPSLVLDIETAAVDPEAVPPALARRLEEAGEEDEDWRDRLGLYALSATVVCIGLFSPETGRGAVLYDDRHGTLEDLEAPARVSALTLVGGDEAAVLTEFWSMVRSFSPVVTYNGRGFDIPFLLQRSLLGGVEVSRNLMPPRFSGFATHLDLAEVLSQYRATRPYGLEAWTQALGLSSPKEGAVKGAEVGAAFAAGRSREIAEYCLRDVVATAEIADRVTALWGRALGLPPVRLR